MQLTLSELAAREEGTNEALAELLNWLVSEQAWPVIETVVERFNDRIQREPALLR